MSNTSVDLSNRLHYLLRRAAAEAGSAFSGIGLLVTDNASSLPVFPLRPGSQLDLGKDPAVQLGQISIVDGALHDGFHILSPELNILALSQYFSPPIVRSVSIDRSRQFGGRYLAALFGSTLEGVLAAGVATPSLGVITFVDGAEATAETLP